MTANVAHMSVAKWTESAASASERCWRAMRPSVRERVKSTTMETSKHGEGPERGRECEMVVADDAANGLVDDPGAGGEHDARLDEGGQGFDLAVAVVVDVVGGAVGDLNGEESDSGGDQIDAGVGRLREHSRASR
jgi:hypothetical protein